MRRYHDDMATCQNHLTYAFELRLAKNSGMLYIYIYMWRTTRRTPTTILAKTCLKSYIYICGAPRGAPQLVQNPTSWWGPRSRSCRPSENMLAHPLAHPNKEPKGPGWASGPGWPAHPLWRTLRGTPSMAHLP